MQKLLTIGLLTLGVAAVAVADIFLKKAAAGNGTFWGAVKNPLFAVAVILYIAQVVIFTHFFTKKMALSYVGVFQTTLYALIVILAAVFFFKERVEPLQAAGMVLAILGVILINL